MVRGRVNFLMDIEDSRGLEFMIVGMGIDGMDMEWVLMVWV